MEGKKITSRIALLFTLLAALFMVLSPQFFSFIFPILLIVPVYMGLKGLRAGKKTGFLLALGIVPLSLAVSVLWLKYFYTIIPNYSKELEYVSNTAKIDINTAKMFLNISFVLSGVMFILSIVVFVLLIKNKKLFK